MTFLPPLEEIFALAGNKQTYPFLSGEYLPLGYKGDCGRGDHRAGQKEDGVGPSGDPAHGHHWQDSSRKQLRKIQVSAARLRDSPPCSHQHLAGFTGFSIGSICPLIGAVRVVLPSLPHLFSCMCVSACGGWNQELVFCFYHVVSGDQTQVVRLGTEALTH